MIQKSQNFPKCCRTSNCSIINNDSRVIFSLNSGFGIGKTLENIIKKSFDDIKKCKFNTNPLLVARRIFYGTRHVDFWKVHIKSFLTHFFRSPYLKNSLRYILLKSGTKVVYGSIFLHQSVKKKLFIRVC